MAEQTKNDETQGEATKGEPRMKLWVQSKSEHGFRRLGRWFGPSWTEVEVTEAEAAQLAAAQQHLQLQTPEVKEQLDALQAKFSQGVTLASKPAAPAAKPTAPARPAPRGRES